MSDRVAEQSSATPGGVSVSGAQDATVRWGPAEPVAAKRASEGNGAVIVVRGDLALAVWDAPVSGHPGSSQLRVSSRGVDGVWTPPERIARFKAAFVQSLNVALRPNGTAIVVWSSGDQIPHVMETHREAGTWSDPERLGGDTSGSTPRAVIDGHGAMTVAWTSGSSSRLAVASRTPGGTWGEVRHLGRYGQDKSIAANRRGDVAVAWGTRTGVRVAIHRHGQDWSPSHNLRSVIAYPTAPQVAIGPAGRVLVMWSRSIEEEETFTRRHLAWARTRFDGTWTTVRYLDTRTRVVYGSTPSLSLNHNGHALAVWSTMTRGRNDMRAARFRFGHGWSPPRGLGVSCCFATALLTPSQTAVAVLHVIRGPDRSATVVAHQRPGQSWQTHTMTSVPYASNADGHGSRMAIVYYGPRLTARMLTVHD